MTERDIFLAVLDLPDPRSRAEYLDKACGGDDALRTRVEALLRSHDSAGSFLGVPAVSLPDPQMSVTQELNSEASPAGDAHADDSLPFLTSSGRPDSLGRLGHYEILQILGRGAFGIVFRAFDDKLHRMVAIKVLSAELGDNATARKRFLREARSAAAICHEHVVNVYAVEEQPLPHLVMEYVCGQTLQDKIDRSGPVELKEVLRIGRQIADGLAAAHAIGLIHRDIKPANILLENGVERVKISDFGLARVADDGNLTQSGVICGTPMYMSPEQAQDDKIDSRSDLFSLGSVLYAMCAGRPPFRAANTIAVLKRVCEETPRSLREINPEIPTWLCDIIGRLHEKEPDDRFGSAEEVADLLARCLADYQQHGHVRSRVCALPSRSPVVAGSPDHATRLDRRSPDEETFGRASVAWSGDPATTGGRNRHWAIAAASVVLVAVLALAVLEWTGATHLFQGRQGIRESANAGGITWHGWPPDAPPPALAPFDAAQAKKHQEAWAGHLGVPVEYTNSVGMKFRLIPPGEFMMGSGASDIDDAVRRCPHAFIEVRIRGEGPQHKVVLTQPIYVGVHEVTQGQYESVAGLQPSHFAITGEGREAVAGEDTTRHPVERVTWQDSVQFCIKLSQREGLGPSYSVTDGVVTLLGAPGYRLPTEAEWESACRAGTTTKYWSGDRDEDLARVAWFAGNAGGQTHPVGELPPNPFGLCDMHGNVWEWMQDWYEHDYYAQLLGTSITNPPGPPSSRTNERIMRGGMFVAQSYRCRSAYRDCNLITNPPAKDVGFRVVLSLEAVKKAPHE